MRLTLDHPCLCFLFVLDALNCTTSVKGIIQSCDLDTTLAIDSRFSLDRKTHSEPKMSNLSGYTYTVKHFTEKSLLFIGQRFVTHVRIRDR